MNLINETVTVIRTAIGSYVNGIYQQGAQSTFSTKVSCQPLSLEETVQVPEADRKRENYKVYCIDELKIDDKFTRTDGKTFVIKDRGNWSVFGNLSHWKCRGVLENS